MNIWLVYGNLEREIPASKYRVAHGTAMKATWTMILLSSHSPSLQKEHAMGAARCEPQGGQIPMELVSCQPPDDFLLQGVLSFNALMGLSCYIKEVCQRLYDSSFNALMGLSCYFQITVFCCIFCQFQCPHGLELLHEVYERKALSQMFQCPHGLELLLQECPIF